MTLPHWLAGTLAASALAVSGSAQAQMPSAFPGSSTPGAIPGSVASPSATYAAGVTPGVVPGASAPAGPGLAGASPTVNPNAPVVLPSTPVVQPGRTPIAGTTTTTTFQAVNPCLPNQFAAFGSALAPYTQCAFGPFGAGGAGQNPGGGTAFGGGLGAGQPGMNNGFGTPSPVYSGAVPGM